MKTDLDILCEKIENCPKRLCQKNRIVCAKNMLNEYIGKDKNKLLEIKAQIQLYKANNKTMMEHILNLVTVLTFPVTILYAASEGKDLATANGYAFMGILLILFFSVLGLVGKKSIRKKEELIQYIEVALESMKE